MTRRQDRDAESQPRSRESVHVGRRVPAAYVRLIRGTVRRLPLWALVCGLILVLCVTPQVRHEAGAATPGESGHAQWAQSGPELRQDEAPESDMSGGLAPYARPARPLSSSRGDLVLALVVGAVLSVPSALWALRLLRKQRECSRRTAQLEREHATDRALLAGLVASAMDAIVSLDAALRIVIFNAAAEQMFGRTQAQMLGQPMDLLVPERLRAAHARHVDAFARTGLTFRRMGAPGRIFGLHADGNEFPIEASISVTAADGKKLLTVIMRDVTERERSEAELREHRDHLQDLVQARTGEYLRAKEEAEASSRAKSQFLANMSHELRTPMHAILSFSDLGCKRAATANVEKVVSYFDSIRMSGRRLVGLIDDLLDLAKLEAGRTVLEVAPIHLHALVAETVAELESLRQQKFLSIEVACTAPDDRLAADGPRISQVVRNLLTNAIKFSPPGGCIHVLVDDAMIVSQDAADEGGSAALRTSVSDRGIGIPENELDAVFQKFVQSSKTRSGAGGTGLGLALCREIVHLHGGRIRARNRYDGGTIFEFVLPRNQPSRRRGDPGSEPSQERKA